MNSVKTVEKSTVFWYTKGMKKEIDLSAMQRRELEEYAVKQRLAVEALEAEVRQYRELIRRANAEKYGAKSEQTKVDENQVQMQIFNEAERYADNAPDPDTASACPPKKKKTAPVRKKGAKAAQIEGVKRETVTFTLTGEEQLCPACGHLLRKMKTVKRSELEVTAPRIVVKNYVQEVYVCDNCEKNSADTTIVSAACPKPLLKGSLVSPSSAAWLFARKYTGRDTLYQLEEELRMQGAKISRATLSNWIVRLSERFLAPLYEGLHRQILRQSVVNLDETPLQVLHEENRTPAQKSYMWTVVSGECCGDRPVVLFHYDPSREGDVITGFLEGYEGKYFQTDGYKGYNRLEKTCTRIGCLAHVRRKYNDVLKSAGQKRGDSYELAVKGVELCDRLFELDKEAAGASEKEAERIKEEQSREKIEELIQWAQEKLSQCPEGTLIYKAVQYTVSQQTYLRNYLKATRVRISNNVAERAIRPFAVGRKIWLFCNTARGAEASEKAYSIVETAKANHLDPYLYLLEIFEHSRGKKTLSEKDVQRLMPWNEQVQIKCRNGK